MDEKYGYVKKERKHQPYIVYCELKVSWEIRKIDNLKISYMFLLVYTNETIYNPHSSV